MLLQDRSWPHVAFREAYALGQVARAACLGAAGDARGAMAAADLALVMGAPAEELAGLVRSVELGAVMAAGAAAAAPGALPTPILPKIPLVLGPDAFLDLPPGLLLPGARAVPRAVAYTPRHATKGASNRSRGARSKKGVAAQSKPRQASDIPAVADHASPAPLAPEEHPLLVRLRSVQEATTDASAPVASAGAVRPLSLAAFRERFRDPGLPVVLCRSTANWAGADRWRSLEHLAERLGHRTVPVEVGQHLSGLWGEEPMLFREFLDRYVAPALEWGWGRRSRVDAAAAVAAGVVAGASEGASPRTASATRAAKGPMWRLVEQPPADADAGGDDRDAALTPTATAIVHPSAIAYVAQHTLFDQVCVLRTGGASLIATACQFKLCWCYRRSLLSLTTLSCPFTLKAKLGRLTSGLELRVRYGS